MSSSLITRKVSTTASKSADLQITLGLIKPSICSYQPEVSQILKRIKSFDPSKIQIVRQKRIFWKTEEAEKFYSEHKGKFYYDRLIAGMTSGPSIALALAGPNVIQDWRALLGPTKAYRAKWEQPDCLRSTFGLGDTRNGFHGSDSIDSALRELGLVFEGFAVKEWLADQQVKRQNEVST